MNRLIIFLLSVEKVRKIWNKVKILNWIKEELFKDE